MALPLQFWAASFAQFIYIWLHWKAALTLWHFSGHYFIFSLLLPFLLFYSPLWFMWKLHLAGNISGHKFVDLPKVDFLAQFTLTFWKFCLRQYFKNARKNHIKVVKIGQKHVKMVRMHDIWSTYIQILSKLCKTVAFAQP